MEPLAGLGALSSTPLSQSSKHPLLDSATKRMTKGVQVGGMNTGHPADRISDPV
jgi:hypothetical protein